MLWWTSFPAVVLLAVWSCAVSAAEVPRYHNLFREYLGKYESEIDAKIEAAWTQFTQGDEKTERLFYPAGDDAAYIFDSGNNDVRSEGMSYGMMIAVQLDRRAEFDRLWTWAKRHMHHADGPRRGYFAWRCTREGRKLDPGSASDGEEWFAMALFFAAHRWGQLTVAGLGEAGTGSQTPATTIAAATGRAIDYAAEAQTLLEATMRTRDAGSGVMPIFDRAQRQVVFAPTTDGARFTDPSYHLPAFYELWARWARAQDDRAFWASVAARSREYFRTAAHPVTGLMPEYAHFDGRPWEETKFGAGKGDFRFDAWRTLANVALDHAWWAADPWQVEQSNRVLRFLGRWGEVCPNQFTLAGEPLARDTSVGLTAMAAVAGLAADRAVAQPFVERLWDAPIPQGQWRYYDGLLYLIGLLQVSGRFQIYAP